MFKNETLFILGAGSSNPYGYPLGKGLVRDIINNIKSDHILIPRLSSSTTQYYYNENDGKQENGNIIHGYELNDFLAFLISINAMKFSAVASQRNSIATGRDNYYLARLNQFNEFFRLREALIKFDPISIDTFLRDHPLHVMAGKIMIVYSLLKREDISKFDVNKQDNNDNWYSFVINDLLSGFDKPEDISNNKLNIITFNYDLSLDYCLKKKLTETGFLKESKHASKYINELLTKNIHHVYGKLYEEDPINVYGGYTSKSKSDNQEELNTRLFIKARQSYDSIKSIYQERKKNEIYGELIANAKEIIIIGFGFDRDNLNTLSFPNTDAGYGDFLNGKKVRYLDYGGKMNSLLSQFEHLTGRFKSRFSVTRSTATSITDAYLNDFKIYLY